jgi:hypothetical protein
MSIALDEHRVIAPLESMARVTVTAVEMLRVTGVQPLHAARQIRIRGSYDEVIVR